MGRTVRQEQMSQKVLPGSMSALKWFLHLNTIPNTNHLTVYTGCFSHGTSTVDIQKVRHPSTEQRKGRRKNIYDRGSTDPLSVLLPQLMLVVVNEIDGNYMVANQICYISFSVSILNLQVHR